MYVPPAFAETRLDALHDLIRHAPLGVLITSRAGLVANHIPFVLHADRGTNGFGLLRAHLARANAQAHAAHDGADALVVFAGVEHYVSPSWYETKRLTGKVVPTWNYVAVHASGPLRIVDDPAWVRAQVGSLTATHEETRAAPWAVEDAPADFTQAQVRAIVGIEIDIVALQGKWKLSQNRNAADRAGVVAGLRDDAEPAAIVMADLVPRG